MHDEAAAKHQVAVIQHQRLPIGNAIGILFEIGNQLPSRIEMDARRRFGAAGANLDHALAWLKAMRQGERIGEHAILGELVFCADNDLILFGVNGEHIMRRVRAID